MVVVVCHPHLACIGSGCAWRVLWGAMDQSMASLLQDKDHPHCSIALAPTLRFLPHNLDLRVVDPGRQVRGDQKGKGRKLFRQERGGG